MLNHHHKAGNAADDLVVGKGIFFWITVFLVATMLYAPAHVYQWVLTVDPGAVPVVSWLSQFTLQEVKRIIVLSMSLAVVCVITMTAIILVIGSAVRRYVAARREMSRKVHGSTR